MARPKQSKQAKPAVVSGLHNKYLAWLFIPAVVISLAYGLGYYRALNVPRLRIATAEEIESARNDVIGMYLAASSTDCADPTDPIKPADRIAVFYKYLKVNRYANRAVIRGCNDFDSLLAKTNSGDWELTSINVSLDTRANPVWQKACLIEDITLADDVVRPENRSIDQFNLEQCNYLRTHNQIKGL